MQMSKKLKRFFSATLIALLLFSVFTVQKAEGADVTSQDLIGTWEARLKINKLELFGTMENQRDELYKQEKVPQTLCFALKDGKLMLSFGSVSMPVTLSGSKLSGTYSGEYMFYNIESTLDGTVNKSARGIELTIHTKQEMWDSKRKNGSIMSCTYTNAGADPVAETPVQSEEELSAEAQEPVEEEVIAVESITIEPKLISLKIGETKQIYVKIKPPGADPGDVVVESYDRKIVGLSGGASVIGRMAGYSEITAQTRDGKFKTKSRVYVGEDNKEVTSVVLDTLWARIKEFLSGESFQVKTPTATCGVRG
jgi:hypothetical protein